MCNPDLLFEIHLLYIFTISDYKQCSQSKQNILFWATTDSTWSRSKSSVLLLRNNFFSSIGVSVCFQIRCQKYLFSYFIQTLHLLHHPSVAVWYFLFFHSDSRFSSRIFSVSCFSLFDSLSTCDIFLFCFWVSRRRWRSFFRLFPAEPVEHVEERHHHVDEDYQREQGICNGRVPLLSCFIKSSFAKQW